MIDDLTFSCDIQEGKYVRAIYDYITQEPSFLSFKKGDIIKVIDKPIKEEGWLFGVCAEHTGYFPSEYVTHIKEVRFWLAFVVELALPVQTRPVNLF